MPMSGQEKVMRLVETIREQLSTLLFCGRGVLLADELSSLYLCRYGTLTWGESVFSLC